MSEGDFPVFKRIIRVATAAFAALVMVLVAAGAANAKPVTPKANEGWIAMTNRACGHDGTDWHAVKAANGGGTWIYLGHTYNVVCKKAGTTKPQSTPKPPTKPSTSGWVRPLGLRYCGDKSTSGWGAPRGKWAHQGVDIDAGRGTHVHATLGGKVVAVQWELYAGWYVVIDTGYYQFVYMHADARSKIKVSVGQRVKTNDFIMLVGSLGQGVTGPHLHFEIHHGLWWNRLNPAPIMRAHGVGVGC